MSIPSLVTLRTTKDAPPPTEGRRTDIERALREAVTGEVRFDDGSRALYLTDASNYREVPIGVVLPKSKEDVIATVAICRSFNVPILPRGGGTSLAGQCCNDAVVLDFTKYMNRVLEVDPVRRIARVEPGVVLDDLQEAVRPHGLVFGPDPATHTHCTLGGMIGNNSCGSHAVQAEFYGPGARTEDNLVSLEVLTYDGSRFEVGETSDEQYERIVQQGGRRARIYEELKQLGQTYADDIRNAFPEIPRRVSGFNLPMLLPESSFNLAKALAGSEATCALTLEATVTLIDRLAERVIVVVGYPSVYEAADDVMLVRKHRPLACEGIDDRLLGFMRKKGTLNDEDELLPEGKGWLIVEFGASTQAEACAQADAFIASVEAPERSNGRKPKARLITDPEKQQTLWEIRKSGLGATAFVPGLPDTWPGWEDAAVPPQNVGRYLREFRKLLDQFDYDGSLYGHFAQGCIHVRINFDLTTQSGIDKYKEFTLRAARLVLDLGGSLSGEHGDGQARGELLGLMYGARLIDAFRRFKQVWDPLGGMNPGKVIDAKPRDSSLRLGAGFEPRPVHSHFRFHDDNGSFARATMRCVGVGKCRSMTGGVMCPSFRVTHEEEHCTRGRAHLLFELLNKPAPIETDWKNKAVHESLDLCLSCKGCKRDCPVSVDMATYKAEFLSHYYKGRLRPRAAYAFGWIYWWAKIASVVPRLANLVTQSRLTSTVFKKIGGVASQRDVPRFAERTFRSWFTTRRRAAQGEEVILWVDTFNNNFHPGTLIAATLLLEELGYCVRIPRQSLCCGRPLYDYGMLSAARRLWLENISALADDIAAGTPIVCLEPSCTAAFRDELADMVDEPEAQRLSKQVVTLAEFLQHRAGNAKLPRLEVPVLLHQHCHHKSVLGLESDKALHRRLGVEPTTPESGCCGMAGAFGFEEKKYEVSAALGEQALAPAVRERRDGTLVVADGFSCREQVTQLAGVLPAHTSEVLWFGIKHQRPPRTTEEARGEANSHLNEGSRARLYGAIGVAFVAFAFVAWRSVSAHSMRLAR